MKIDWIGDSEYSLTCSSIVDFCGKEINNDCYNTIHLINNNDHTTFTDFSFSKLEHYDECLTCVEEDYTLSTIIFNFFIFCQLFNEISSRSLGNELDFFEGILQNRMFCSIIVFSIFVQFIIVSVGGSFMKTTPLTLIQWLKTILLASKTLQVGKHMRYIPIKENSKSFFIQGKNIIKTEMNDEGSGYTTPETSGSYKISKIHKKSNSKSRNEVKELTEELTAKLLINV
jgi:magnesium-transporting ATPase (P-type)